MAAEFDKMLLIVDVFVFFYNKIITIMMKQSCSNCLFDENMMIVIVSVALIVVYHWKHRISCNKIIVDLQQTNLALSKQNYLDDLTMLPNRRALTKHLESLIEKSHMMNKEFFLLFIDIDDFKQINDQFGHDVGDQVLYQFSHRISRNEQFTARISGDEFIVTMMNRSADDVRQIVNELIEELAHPYHISDDLNINVSVSIGISNYPSDGTEMTSLIKRADMAMYEAKQQGKNTFSFYIRKCQDFRSVIEVVE